MRGFGSGAGGGGGGRRMEERVWSRYLYVRGGVKVETLGHWAPPRVGSGPICGGPLASLSFFLF